FDFLWFLPVNSSASGPASYTLRRASVIAGAQTETARACLSVMAKSSTNDWMLPSKMMPTNSALRLMTGLPELPPMMSAVQTKLNGVFKFRRPLRLRQRCGIEQPRQFDHRITRGIHRGLAFLVEALAEGDIPDLGATHQLRRAFLG